MLKFLGSPELLVQKGAMVLKFCKTSFLEVKLRISEIHLQQQIHDTGKERSKMIIEFYIIMTRLYYKVKVRNEMSLFLGENQYFYKKNPFFL